MRHRIWIMALGLGAAAALATAGVAAEPNKSNPTPTFGFSTLRALSVDAAKARVAELLRAAGRYQADAFEQVWRDESRSLVDRVADALALAHPDAKAALDAARNLNLPPPDQAPAFVRDSSLDPFVRTNLALAFAKAAANRKAYEEALEALNAGVPEMAVDPPPSCSTKRSANTPPCRKTPQPVPSSA